MLKDRVSLLSIPGWPWFWAGALVLQIDRGIVWRGTAVCMVTVVWPEK